MTISDPVLVAIVGGCLGGSAVAALINQIGNWLQAKSSRKYKTEEKESETVKAIKTALKWVMYDRIRWLGQAYVRDKEVDFDDRRILHEMHNCYHNGLGGNGDLDALMDAVNKLPLKN